MAEIAPELRWGLPLGVLACALGLTVAAPAGAANLLLGQGERWFGVGGGGASASAGATAGLDALVANPAGLAKGARSEWLLDGGELRSTTWRFNGDAEQRLDAPPGALAFVRGPSRANPRFGVGAYGFAPQDQHPRLASRSTETVREGQLSPYAPCSVGCDSLFPEGIQRVERAESASAWRVLAFGVGVGVVLADGLRLGVDLRLERVSLNLRDVVTRTYSAAAAGGSNILAGFSHATAVYRGNADRAQAGLGLQIDLTQDILLGVVARLPSETLQGVAVIEMNRVDTIDVQQSGTSAQSNTARVRASAEGSEFRLPAPGSVRVGLAVRFEMLVFAFDLEQVERLPGTDVFPGVESEPPSTVAARIAPIRVRADAVTRRSVTAALAQGSTGIFLFGWSEEPSGYSSTDPVFAAANLTRAALGYYVTRGPLAMRIRLAYSAAENPAARLRRLTDTDDVRGRLLVEEWTSGIAVAISF